MWKMMLCKASCVIWWAYPSKIELLPLNGKPNWAITINVMARYLSFNFKTYELLTTALSMNNYLTPCTNQPSKLFFLGFWWIKLAFDNKCKHFGNFHIKSKVMYFFPKWPELNFFSSKNQCFKAHILYVLRNIILHI